MFEMENNSLGQPDVEISIDADDDDGLFISMVVTNSENNEEMLDLVAGSDESIREFFAEVEHARLRYEELKKER